MSEVADIITAASVLLGAVGTFWVLVRTSSIKKAVNGNHHAALKEIQDLRKQLKEERGGTTQTKT